MRGERQISPPLEREAEFVVSRRNFLKLAALLGGGAGAAAFLEACGSSNNNTNKPAANASNAGSTGGAATAAAAGSPSGASNIKLAADQTVRYVDTEPTYMDPGLTTSLRDLDIIENVWEGLLDFDEKGNPIRLGATSWDISPDGITYTFHLRDGVHWTDGTPITAKDYEWTWKRNEDPKTASQYAQALYNVKGAQDYNLGKNPDPNSVGVKAIDDKTLQVTLTGPAGYFLRIASTWTAFPLPQQSIDKYGAKWVEAGNVVSNGPYKIDKWNHDQQIVLVRNEGYWGPKATLDKITITLTTDIPKTSLPAFENNELDYAIGPWPADQDRINSDATLSKQLHLFPFSGTEFVVCDTTNTNSPVSKPQFRQALYLSIDRDQIVNNVFKKIYTSAYTVLPADILGNNPAARIPGGVKEAKASLTSAGISDPKSVNVTLVYAQSANNDLLGQVLQEMWKNNLGINLTLNAMELKAYTAYNKTLKTGHYELKFGGWISDYLDPFDWMNFLFKSDTDFFHSHWSNADYDNLVTQAAVLSNQNKRKDLYSQAETILVKDAAVIPMYYLASPYLIKPWVSGYAHTSTGFDKFATAKIAQH